MTNSAIRKAAILISSLDNASGDALLEQMDPEMSERVRNALMDLEEISVDEEDQVIAAFLKRPMDDNGGVDLDPALALRMAKEPEPQSDDREPPFHFLRDAEPSLLAEYLEKEHPQTAAVVIAHLPPEQAAQVLERMPAGISTEALRRMAWLDELAPEVLRDLEWELKAALLPKMRRPERRLAGLASVQAVLSAVNGLRRSELLDRLAEQDQRLVRQLGYGGGEQGSFRYRLEPPPLLETQTRQMTDATSTPTQSHGRATQEAITTTAEEFEELFSLEELEMRRVFAAAAMPLLVLALTGAPEKLAQRILRKLPQREAEILRHKLSHPGPLRLSDIEAAQQEIVRIAQQLAARGEISLQSRSFAAAV
jgi:flagellar motor switch protein FliG